MELKEYLNEAMKTRLKSCDNFSYMMMNLVGEVGEFASKIAKMIRKEKLAIGTVRGIDGKIQKNQLIVLKENLPTEQEWRDLKGELGDIMWQLFGLIDQMGEDPEEVAKQNLEKLRSRKERGVISGDGDNR